MIEHGSFAVVSLQDFSDAHSLDALCTLQHPLAASSTMAIWQLSGFVNNLVLENAPPLEISTQVEPDTSSTALFFMTMRAGGEVSRYCQRCLAPLSNKINLELNWQVMHAVLPNSCLRQGYEPLAAGDYPGIVPLFVQEIILYLPDIPMHAIANCSPHGARLVDNSTHKIKPGQQPNQFAALATLTKGRPNGEN